MAGQSCIRNGMVDPQQADHCTRCRKPFKANAIRFMVQEHVVCEVIQETLAITRTETVPVCKACVTIEEQTRSTSEAICECCGVPMLMSEHKRSRLYHVTCSNRCAQRERRQRKYRYRPHQQTCVVCKMPFHPTRANAEYCSNACRQRAHRLRHA